MSRFSSVPVSPWCVCSFVALAVDVAVAVAGKDNADGKHGWHPERSSVDTPPDLVVHIWSTYLILATNIKIIGAARQFGDGDGDVNLPLAGLRPRNAPVDVPLPGNGPRTTTAR